MPTVRPVITVNDVSLQSFNILKGYSRLGAAYSFLQNPSEAEKAYKKGLEIDPNNTQLQNELKTLKDQFSGKHWLNYILIEDYLKKDGAAV